MSERGSAVEPTRNESAQGEQDLSEPTDPVGRYQQLADRWRNEIGSLTAASNRLFLVRGILFLAALGAAAARFADVWGYGGAWFWVAGLIFVAFLVVASIHATTDWRREQTRFRLRSARVSIARCQRKWKALPPCPVPANQYGSIENVARDLDLFNNEGLYQLLGTVHTPLGIQTLADWISRAADVDTIGHRQAAVAELKERFDWRLELNHRCEMLAASPTGPVRFVEWAEGDVWLGKRPALVWLTRISTAISGLCLLGVLTGLLPIALGGPALVGLFVFNFVLSVCFTGQVHGLFEQVSSRRSEVAAYQAIFASISDYETQSPLLGELQQQIIGSPNGAQTRLAGLNQLVAAAGLRRHGLLGFLIYVPAQFWLLWDFHVLHLLEGWQQRHGHLARQWFDALGSWESLAAMGTLAWEQPDWVFPKLRDPAESESESAEIAGSISQTPGAADAVASGPLLFAARKLGHPLIAEQERVCNDVALGPVGSLLLVTGSNMSGKSTLLRSIGVNQTLAQMGSVVCATEMHTTVFRLATSMRIHDQLSAGVSFFMAELQRLKQIIDQASEPGPRLLFLLDEILQGTNSAERHIAVTHVVHKLVAGGAVGAVSTHDLELANPASLGEICQTVHFREHFQQVDGQETMCFDYVMRPGVAPSSNALKLLQLVGIDYEA